MLWGKPISNGECPHSSSAASFRHHAAMAHNRTRAIPTAMEKHQHMRSITARSDRPFSVQTVHVHTLKRHIIGHSPDGTDCVESLATLGPANGRGLERSNARTLSSSL